MFLRLVEADVATQRKFHGRLAQIVLGNHYQQEGLNDLLDIWYIGAIARLHQTPEWTSFYDRVKPKPPDEDSPLDDDYKPLADDSAVTEPRRFITYRRICQLGGVLLLADGLDIHHGRADKRIHVSFSQVLGPLHPKSDIEWLVNSLVTEYELKPTVNEIHAIYTIDAQEAVDSLMLHFATGAAEQAKRQQAAESVQAFLWRYLYDAHFSKVMEVFPSLKLKVTVKYPNVPKPLDRGPTRSHRPPYSKMWSFWYDGVHQLEFGPKIQAILGEGSQLEIKGGVQGVSNMFCNGT